MSRQQKLNNEDTNKVRESPAKGIAKSLESAIQCNPITIKSLSEKNPSANKSGRPTQAVHSDGNIIKNQDQQGGIKQKLVNKVKSWSSKDGRGLQSINSTSSTKPDPRPSNIALDLESLSLEDILYNSDLRKAKDSLENLVGTKSNKTCADNMNLRPLSHSSSSQEKRFSSAGPHSDASLRCDTTTESTSKVMTWDPWNKLGRKNKKENKRRKQLEKSPHSSRDNSRTHSPIIKNIEHTAGDDPRSSINDLLGCEDLRASYEYQPYRKKRRSVEFLNDVLVVNFTGDDVITKSTEPLKKELDQQIRNKEMRRGHVPCTLLGKRQSSGEDYMASWFKK